MMFRTVIPLLLLLIPLLGWAEARNENIRVCGPYLMEMMTAMCPNGFNGIYQKRDSMIFDYVMADGDENAVSEDHHGRMNSLTGLRRIYRGIVDECCLKPCSKATMKKYCRD
ncbi:probable insulin-like peptide 5 [Drosophila suzukii]|uniref:Probable insulin-like peptide 5 n=1 Tax=Drosophila suzukii TaxID=28584 RepID=A0AB39ZEI0_DROSZ|nr:probable insulin-like peptide 5 isoform X1 [Drosophila suzukii]